jgi:hypothetical protein
MLAVLSTYQLIKIKKPSKPFSLSVTSSNKKQLNLYFQQKYETSNCLYILKY